jgi:hypothetical protein
MCKKSVVPVAAKCPRCQADLSLLCDFRDEVSSGLTLAEQHTRAGDLSAAVWAYLRVLEVDPENPTAQDQVGTVAAAVRQFDRVSPSRRWLRQLKRQEWVRRWLTVGRGAGWKIILTAALLAALSALAYHVGYRSGARQAHSAAES